MERGPGMAGHNVVELTDSSFATEVESGEGLVLVDFWAPWCMPCRAVAPVVQQLAEAYAGKVKVGKLNVDENPETAAAYGIRSIPTLALFKDGEPVEGVLGAVPRSHLETMIRQHLSAEA
jgi:thioredoxin 1